MFKLITINLLVFLEYYARKGIWFSSLFVLNSIKDVPRNESHFNNNNAIWKRRENYIRILKVFSVTSRAISGPLRKYFIAARTNESFIRITRCHNISLKALQLLDVRGFWTLYYKLLSRIWNYVIFQMHRTYFCIL